MVDCHTPPGGIHHCQLADEAAAEARNLLLFARFANPDRLPRWSQARSAELVKLLRRHRLRSRLRTRPFIPAQRTPRDDAEMWLRPGTAAVHPTAWND